MISPYNNVSGVNSNVNVNSSRKADSRNVNFGAVSILNNVYNRGNILYIEKPVNDEIVTTGQTILQNVISQTKTKLIDYVKFNLQSAEIKGTGVKGFFRSEDRSGISDKVYAWKTDDGKTAFITEDEADKFSELLNEHISKVFKDKKWNDYNDKYMTYEANERHHALYAEFANKVNDIIIKPAIKATKGKIKPSKPKVPSEQAKKRIHPAKFFDVSINADNENAIDIKRYDIKQ
jgi:hypothetical protein